MINMFGLQPQARPVDTFTATQPVSDEIAKLAQGLSGFGNNLADVATKYGGMTAQALEAEATEYAKIQAAKAENIAAFDAAVKRGEIKYQDVPWVNTMIRQQVAANMVAKNVIDATPGFLQREDQFNTSDEVVAYFQNAAIRGLDPNDPEIAAVALPAANAVAMEKAQGFVLKRSEKRDKDLQSAISDGVHIAAKTGNLAGIVAVAERNSVLVPREKVIAAAVKGFQAYALSDPDFAGSEQFEQMFQAFTVTDSSGNRMSLADTAEGAEALAEIQQKAANLVYQRDLRQVAKEERERAEQTRATNEYVAGLIANPANKNSDGSLNAPAIINAVTRFDPNTPINVLAGIANGVASLNTSTNVADHADFQNEVIRTAVADKLSLSELMQKPYGTSGQTFGQIAASKGLYPVLLNGWGTADNLNDFTDEQFQTFLDNPDTIDAKWLNINGHRLNRRQAEVAANIVAANAKGYKPDEFSVDLLKNSVELNFMAAGTVPAPAGTPDPTKAKIDAAVLEYQSGARALAVKINDPAELSVALDKLLWDVSRRFGGFESREKYQLATDADVKRRAEEEQSRIQKEQERIAEEISTPGSKADERFQSFLKNADETTNPKAIFVKNALAQAAAGVDPSPELERIGFGSIEAVNSRKHRSVLQKLADIKANKYGNLPQAEKRRASASMLLRAAKGEGPDYPNRVLFFSTPKQLLSNVNTFVTHYGLTPEEAALFTEEQLLTLEALEAKKTYGSR